MGFVFLAISGYLFLCAALALGLAVVGNEGSEQGIVRFRSAIPRLSVELFALMAALYGIYGFRGFPESVGPILAALCLIGCVAETALVARKNAFQD